VPDELTVGELLQRCSKRPPDDAAWEQFIEQFHPTIRAFVVRTFRQRARVDPDRVQQFPEDLIDDLIQSVYAKLIEDGGEALARFAGDHEKSIYQYLGMISMNLVRDHFREASALKRPKVSISLTGLIEGSKRAVEAGVNDVTSVQPADSDVALAEEEMDNLLKRTITGRNPDRDLLIFKLRFYHDMTLEEIAESLCLDITPVTVGSIINRIIARLKPLMKRSGRIRR
jgi:RNA polymerase sigma factor (sigma-70 family)